MRAACPESEQQASGKVITACRDVLPHGSSGVAAWLRGTALSQGAQPLEGPLPEGMWLPAWLQAVRKLAPARISAGELALWLQLQGSGCIATAGSCAMQYNRTFSLVRHVEAMARLAEKATTIVLPVMQHV